MISPINNHNERGINVTYLSKLAKLCKLSLCRGVSLEGLGHKKAVARRLFAFSLLQRTRFKRRRVVLSRYLPGW